MSRTRVFGLTLAAVFCGAQALSQAHAEELSGTLKNVKETGAITLGYRDSSIPFSYLDDNQKPIGYAMDICYKIVDAVKKELKLDKIEVKLNPVTSATRIPLIANGTIDLEMLEHFVREDLNKRAPRVMAVLRPLKLVVDNYPEGQVEEMEAVNNPEDSNAGTRKVPFSRVLYIEQEDFCENPPKQYYRLSPGREVRLRYGYFVTCTSVVKNDKGEPIEVHCTYDPASRGGNSPDGRKVKSTIHWVSAAHAVDAEVRLYDKLFTKPDPNEIDEGKDFTANLNPNSLEIGGNAKVEPALADPAMEARYQFERIGYSCADPDSKPGKPVFNRTVALKDTWAKIEKGQRAT